MRDWFVFTWVLLFHHILLQQSTLSIGAILPPMQSPAFQSLLMVAFTTGPRIAFSTITLNYVFQEVNSKQTERKDKLCHLEISKWDYFKITFFMKFLFWLRFLFFMRFLNYPMASLVSFNHRKPFMWYVNHRHAKIWAITNKGGACRTLRHVKLPLIEEKLIEETWRRTGKFPSFP